MKKEFIMPELKSKSFSAKDIITTSGSGASDNTNLSKAETELFGYDSKTTVSLSELFIF